jgi:hypothetical protein
VADAMLARQRAGGPAPTLTFDPRFEGRPHDHRSSAMKVLVLMSDGKNHEQRDIPEAKKSGPSGVFAYRPGLSIPGPDTDGISGDSRWSSSWWSGRVRAQNWAANGNRYTGHPWWTDADRRNWDGFDASGRDSSGNWVTTRYSIWSEQHQMFWLPHLERYETEPLGGTDAIELSFQEFFAAYSRRHVDDRFMLVGDGLDSATKNFYSSAYRNVVYDGAAQDADLTVLCSNARDAGILIYTIAFQTDDAGRATLKACSDGSGGAHFNVADLDIEGAFDDIVTSVRRLRLSR